MIYIYAIRDRLIDYFMQPFIGPEDNKPVLASVAKIVNQGEMTSDIAQAPHHFEVWQLGKVDAEGNLLAERQLIADCSSLVRKDIRPFGPPRDPESPGAEISRHRGIDRPYGFTGAETGPLPSQAPGQALQAPKARPDA